MRESQQKKPQAPRVRVKKVDSDTASHSAGAAPRLSSGSSPLDADGLELPLLDGDAPAAKKRRRRRKPVGSTAQGQEGGSDAPQSVGAPPVAGD